MSEALSGVRVNASLFNSLEILKIVNHCLSLTQPSGSSWAQKVSVHWIMRKGKLSGNLQK